MFEKRLESFLEGHRRMIWDWNGTLVNDIDYAVSTINRVLACNELPLLSKADYRRLFGFPVRHYYERIGFDFTKHDFQKVGTQFIEFYIAEAKNLSLFHGVADTILSLKKKGLRHSILSAGHQAHLDEMLTHFELDTHFDHIFGIDNHYAASKIERGHELMKVWGANPAETVMIGDTDHDLEVGKALGIDVILIADGHQSFERLSAIHDRVIESRYAVDSTIEACLESSCA